MEGALAIVGLKYTNDILGGNLTHFFPKLTN
jgi:hypothetical protein